MTWLSTVPTPFVRIPSLLHTVSAQATERKLMSRISRNHVVLTCTDASWSIGEAMLMPFVSHQLYGRARTATERAIEGTQLLRALEISQTAGVL